MANSTIIKIRVKKLAISLLENSPWSISVISKYPVEIILEIAENINVAAITIWKKISIFFLFKNRTQNIWKKIILWFKNTCLFCLKIVAHI